MSGLVSTYSAWSRVQSRCSRELSPSWVATRTSSPSAVEAGELVLGQRLGRAEVERGGPALPARPAGGADVGQRRQLVAQRLARRRAGRQHDVPAGVRRLRGHRPGAARARARLGPSNAATGRRRAPRPATPPRPPPAPAAPRGGSAVPRGRAPPSSRSTTSRIETGERSGDVRCARPHPPKWRGHRSRAESEGFHHARPEDCLLFPRTTRRRGLIGARGRRRRALARTGAQTRAVEKTWT